jgi:hypothetical protein
MAILVVGTAACVTGVAAAVVGNATVFCLGQTFSPRVAVDLKLPHSMKLRPTLQSYDRKSESIK